MSKAVVFALGIALAFWAGGCGDAGLGCDLVMTEVPGDAVPEPGAALDPGWPVLAGPTEFDRSGTRIETGDSGEPVVRLVLRSPAAERLAAYTATHVGSYLAIAVDGRIEIVPMVMAGIPDGTIDLSLPTGDPAADHFRACL
jgi:hypothetical protein